MRITLGTIGNISVFVEAVVTGSTQVRDPLDPSKKMTVDMYAIQQMVIQKTRESVVRGKRSIPVIGPGNALGLAVITFVYADGSTETIEFDENRDQIRQIAPSAKRVGTGLPAVVLGWKRQ